MFAWQNTPRNSTFYSRINTLMRDGFTREEAQWAALRRLRLSDPTIREVRQARRDFINRYLTLFQGSTREQAVAAAARLREDRASASGLSAADIYNIFKEISVGWA